MRDHNPAFEQAEAVLTALEGGLESLLFASGMAAACWRCSRGCSQGITLLAPKVMYWSLRNWLTTFGTRWGLVSEILIRERWKYSRVAANQQHPYQKFVFT